MEETVRLGLRIRFLLGTVCLFGMLLVGCDSGANSSFASSSGAVPSNSGTSPNTLTLDLSSLVRSSREVARMEVTAFSLRGAKLAQEKATSTLLVRFSHLPAGSARLRVVAFGDSDQVLGFSDLLVPVPSAKTLEPPPLDMTDRVPPPATPGAPFLAFLTMPSTFEAGTTYTLEVGAFDTQGQLDTKVERSLSISSYGAPVTLPSSGLKFVQGRATIDSVFFRRGTNGTVTFTTSAGGFASATSPTLPVRSR